VAERTFEMELDKLFAAAPVLADADAFAARVGERLDRGWTFRQFVIGGLGIAGGLIGGAQILGSGLVGRLHEIRAQSHDAVNDVTSALANELGSSRLSQWSAAHGVSGLLASGSSTNGQFLWMSAALAVLAVGLFVTRAIREI